ncbi:unnamed protein product [Clavelina lepadiformis]|uniref:Uncharacterized protein n=1 Tax=Clavelina lepadiformis TaxID=159417 RepID=A0ABP0GJJ3_CLALP
MSSEEISRRLCDEITKQIERERRLSKNEGEPTSSNNLLAGESANMTCSDELPIITEEMSGMLFETRNPTERANHDVLRDEKSPVSPTTQTKSAPSPAQSESRAKETFQLINDYFHAQLERSALAELYDLGEYPFSGQTTPSCYKETSCKTECSPTTCSICRLIRNNYRKCPTPDCIGTSHASGHHAGA